MPERIPIFPLGTVVLFPNTSVPLYIFETRYRQMIREALEGDGRIGMVTVQPDGIPHMAGDPPVFPTGCEGRITDARANADGSYHLTLEGVRRFRILEEPARSDAQLYRAAEVEPLDDRLDDSEQPDCTRMREQLTETLRHMLPVAEDDEPEPLETFADLDDGEFINALSQAIDFGPLEKQDLFECDSIAARYERMVDLLTFRMAEASGGSSIEPGTMH